MGQLVQLNHELIDRDEARISPFDRGFLFADGGYEVCSVLSGALIDLEPHLNRLMYTFRELSFPLPWSKSDIGKKMRELVRLNEIDEGYIYLQITRGPSVPRDFSVPSDPKPTLFMFTESKNIVHPPWLTTGAKAVTVEDIRWRRRDIKSISLLAQVLAKEEAAQVGAHEAWMVENGLVTEGASSTAYIVDAQRQLITRHLSRDVLAGITRDSILQIVAEENLSLIERAFSVEEAYAAGEAFITSSTVLVMPIVTLDDRMISDGKPGPVALKLRDLYLTKAGVTRDKKS